MHGYICALSTLPLLTSQSVASHNPWPHRGGMREKSPESLRMDVLLPTKWRSHTARVLGLLVMHPPPDWSRPWSNLKRPVAEAG